MPANLHQSVEVEEAVKKRIQADSHLLPYAKYIRRRVQQAIKTEHRITGGQMDLSEFASGHEYFGMHFQNGHWVFRERAPNATASLPERIFFRLELRKEIFTFKKLPDRRVVQDSETYSFNAQIWQPHRPYEWKNSA